jgi:hypothetical protein
VTSAQPLPPAARLLELTTEAEDLYPPHTFKASMWHVDRLPTVEEKCQKLEAGIGEFKRGMAT